MSVAHTGQFDRRLLSLRLDSVLFYGIFGLLMFGPLAFGAVEPWSIFFLESGAACLALVWLARQWLDGEIKVKWNPLFLPMAAFGLLIAAQLVFRISAYRHDTMSGFLLYCAYGALCFVSSQTVLRTAQARKLGLILCVYGAVLATFSLLQGISPNGKLYWVRVPSLGGWIYGPYVNHNHYAGLMEMLIPVPLVLCLTHLTHSKQRIAAATAAAIMAGTIFLSGSRGGMLALLGELILLAVVLVKQRRDLRTAMALGVFLLISVGLLGWLGGDELLRRLATVQSAHTELSADMRVQINRDGLRMFLSKPIFGWGLQAFPIVYPQFRTFYTNFFVNQAHNDYLQLLVEMGLIGFGTTIWFLVVLCRSASKKIGSWTSQVSGAMTFACSMGFTGILIHSAVDFNLQIPANAALFYVICTLASADPLLHPVRKRRPIRQPDEEQLATMPASEVV